jgi:hypothetical protein
LNSMHNRNHRQGQPMYRRVIKKLAFFMCVVVFGPSVPCGGTLQAMEAGDCLGAVSLRVARSLELTLEHVADSVRALAEEYVRVYEATPPMDSAERDLWMKQVLEKGKTLSFHPFSSGPDPAFQAPVPAYLFYNGRDITPNVTRELKTFVSLAPLFRAAYLTFRYSWVYMTTADEAFLIYPYLPLDQAVHNLPPTKQDFYKAADFEGRGFGWERPYLDLAGAGMMVTVSYPVYGGERLLGVMSRDITLKQLSRRLLSPAGTRPGHPISLIMDRDGLAVAADNAAAAEEIDRVNTRAGKAVLHYRTSRGLSALGNPKAVPSSTGLYNEAGESALAAVQENPHAQVWHLNLAAGQTARKAAAARIPSTGWILITMDADR